MEGLKLIPYIALLIAITGVVIGAAVLVVSKFGDSSSIDKCYNASYRFNSSPIKCDGYSDVGEVSYNITESHGKDGLNFSDEYYTVWKTQEGNRTIAEQIPTVAIIGVMVIIISIIAGVFVYMKYFA